MPAPIIGFAHRGAPSRSQRENTLPAFQRALALGAGGLETDIGLTADGVPVLIHAGLSLRRRVPVSRLRRAELPPHIPALADLYARCGHDFELSLDMAEPRAAAEVVRVASETGAESRLWLTYWHLATLGSWRDRWPGIRLVYPTIPTWASRSIRLVSELRSIGVDAVNVYHRRCSSRFVTCAQERGLLVFAWGVRSWRPVERLVRVGVDGVYCDDVTAMVNALRSSK